MASYDEQKHEQTTRIASQWKSDMS